MQKTKGVKARRVRILRGEGGPTRPGAARAKRVVGGARGPVCLDITGDVTSETRRSPRQELLRLVTGGAARTPPVSHVPDLTSEGQISDLGRPVPIVVPIF